MSHGPWRQRRCLLVGVLVVLSHPAPCRGQVDYLLHRLADPHGRPPWAMAMPQLMKAFDQPRPGLGPLLTRMTACDPVFRRAYEDFLRYMDDLNSRLARAGAGAFRLQVAMPGLEDFVRAVTALGGSGEVTIASNDLGVTYDALMDTARTFADRSLRESALTLDKSEHTTLVDLLALAQIAALANRVMPTDYVTQWELRHPERPHLPAAAPPGIPEYVWRLLRDAIPWMYHSGALPWPDGDRANPHEAYDAYHFFSHAWLVHFDLYRRRYFQSSLLTGTYRERTISAWALRWELVWSDAVGWGYELATSTVGCGFLDITPAEALPAGWRETCRRLSLKGLPIIEAWRDLQTDSAGAVFGAALAMSSRPLAPSAAASHALVLKRTRLS